MPVVSTQVGDQIEPACGSCRRDTYKFDFARSYGLYSDVLRHLILRVKFRHHERLGYALGALLTGLWPWALEVTDGRAPVLVPVPLHSSRRRERGFNQAELMARGCQRALARLKKKPPPVEGGWIERVQPTRPQSGLDPRARRENVRGVFAVSRKARPSGVSVVLVDDVMTTGATLSACARELKRAGAVRVIALTAARATPLFPDVRAEAVDAMPPEP